MRPECYKYIESHEWIKWDENKKEATVGITDYAVTQLADLVHIDLPKIGDNVEQGAPFGEIESVKTVADLITPLTGKIIEVNKNIARDLDTLKKKPFEDGWLIRIKPSDMAEFESIERNFGRESRSSAGRRESTSPKRVPRVEPQSSHAGLGFTTSRPVRRERNSRLRG